MKKIRTLLKECNYTEALDAIDLALKDHSDLNDLILLANYSTKIPDEIYEDRNYHELRIAWLNGYTTDFIQQALRAQLLKDKIRLHIYSSDYGVFEQIIYSQDQALKEFAPNICYFCVGREHVLFNDVEEETSRWQKLIEATTSFLNCDVVLNNFIETETRIFGNFESKEKSSATNFIKQLNHDLTQKLTATVHINDVNQLANYHGIKNWIDPRLQNISKIPVAMDLIPLYAKNIADVCRATLGKTAKCLVLDLDNTLWGGIIGEDGLSGIKIGEDSDDGESYLRFQAYILELQMRGVILAVCSKNDEKNALEVFDKHESMLLKRKHFSAFFANWEPKDRNIQAIAKELNIGLDSMVFVDDSAVERALVRAHLPTVHVLELPKNPADYLQALNSENYFDTVRITSEDQDKTSQYQAKRARDELATVSGNYGEFLQSLTMQAILRPFDDLNRPRITQLINKTNQFNLTTRRYPESEVQVWQNSPGVITRYLKLKDKFGDNGLISVFIGKVDPKASVLLIDTWLMSCRVLKRGVEYYLFNEILAEARRLNIQEIRGEYRPTEKNHPVSQLLPELGFKLDSKNNDRSWVFTVKEELPKSCTYFITPVDTF